MKISVEGQRKSFESDDSTNPLLSVIEDHGVSWPFGCRSGNCGACVAKIIQGAEHLEPLDFIETETLKAIGHPDGRLLCRVSMKANPAADAVLVIRPV